MANASQTNRELEFISPLGKDVLLLHKLTAVEELGRPFQFELILRSTQEDIDFESLLGKNASIRLATSVAEQRYFNGFVTESSQDQNSEGFATYKAILHKNPLVRIATITTVGYLTPKIDPELLDIFLEDESLGVIAATIKVIGENKVTDYDEHVWEFITHEDEEIRFRVAFAGDLIGVKGVNEALQKFCFGDETPYLKEALSLLFQIIPESDLASTLARIHKSSLYIRIKAYSIAMAGLPDRIPALLEWMKDPEYAPLAGEAFSFITGADIEEDDLSILDVEICEAQEAPLAEKRKADPWTEAYEDDLP